MVFFMVWLKTQVMDNQRHKIIWCSLNVPTFFVFVTLNTFNFEIVEGHDQGRDIAQITATILMVLFHVVFFAYVSDKIEYISVDQEKHLNEFSQYKNMFDCL